MIIWSGWGMLSVLIAGAALVLSVLLDPALTRFGLPTPTGVVLIWLVAAFANWTLGTRLNVKPDRELIDAHTGERIILRSRHTLFWVPMQYYSVLMLLFGALAAFAAFMAHGPGRGV